MVIFFGPTGSGKSVQGQMLATSQNWQWISAGQLLRDTHDLDLLKTMQSGELVLPDKVNAIVGDALSTADDINHVVLDGFPRSLEQAKWLVDNQSSHNNSIGLAIVLDVPRDELIKRLNLRGRVDDNKEAIDERLRIYNQKLGPILDYLTEQGVKVVHIDGSDSAEQVHELIMGELTLCKIV